MRWSRVDPANAEKAGRFLSERESVCTAAAAKFREIEGQGFADGAPGTVWIGAEDDGTPRSAIIRIHSGSLFPVFDDAGNRSNKKALIRVLSRLSGNKPVRSVQGRLRDVAVVESVMASPFRVLFGASRRTVVDPVDYVHMSLDAEPSADSLNRGPAGLGFFLAGEADADGLFPLQEAYEREEVVPAGAPYSVAAARLAFERTLRDQIVMYARLDGKIVAKAGTNARAYARDQIGGVYALPAFRGLGIGTRLVAELCARLRKTGRASSLFVKKGNAAAIAVYTRIGFSAGEGYRITYYLKENAP